MIKTAYQAEGLSGETSKTIDNSTDNIHETIITNSTLIEDISNTIVTEECNKENTTKRNIPSPFKKVLTWPENISNNKKNRRRQSFPLF